VATIPERVRDVAQIREHNVKQNCSARFNPSPCPSPTRGEGTQWHCSRPTTASTRVRPNDVCDVLQITVQRRVML